LERKTHARPTYREAADRGDAHKIRDLDRGGAHKIRDLDRVHEDDGKYIHDPPDAPANSEDPAHPEHTHTA